MHQQLGSFMFARSLKFVLPIVVVMSAEHAKSADPLKIRLAWAVVPSELSPILFVKPGIAKHVGVTYAVEPIHFAAAPFMITALATGEVDIAPFSYSTIPNAVQNAGLTDLGIIADEFQDGVEGYYTNQFMVRGTRTQPTMTRQCKSLRSSQSDHQRCLRVGCLRNEIITVIRMACRIWMSCNKTSMHFRHSGSRRPI